MVASNQTIQNNFKRYLLPGALTFVLVLLLSLGGLYLRGFFMEQVAQERSSQLKEMSGQICVNLDYNLETHWNLVTGLKGSCAARSSTMRLRCSGVLPIWSPCSGLICMAVA